MIGFGEKLRREREMRGVSLEEISESTKIGTRSLRALEEDDFEKLPGGIFNRGFVRAYARFLGLDEDQTVADFDAASKEYDLARGQVEEATLEEEEPEPVNSKAPWLVAAALVLIVGVAAAGYFLKRTAMVRATPPPENAQDSQSSRATTPPSSTATPTSSVNLAPTTPIAPATHEAKAVESSAQTSTTTNSAGSKSALENASSKSNSAAESPSDSSSPIRLEVFAREESWLSVSADGRDLGQQLLAAQKSRTIHAQKEVRLKLGNVGGVEISFNGKPVNIDGEPKQVKEFTFTPEGLQQ